MYPSLRKSLHERIKPEEKGSAGSALFSINLIFSITTWAKVNAGEKRKIENVSWLFKAEIFITGRCFFLKKNPAIYVD